MIYSLFEIDHHGLSFMPKTVKSNIFTLGGAVATCKTEAAIFSGFNQSGWGFLSGLVKGVLTTPGQTILTAIFEPDPCNCRAIYSIIP